jgi:hypothetical protein
LESDLFGELVSVWPLQSSVNSWLPLRRVKLAEFAAVRRGKTLNAPHQIVEIGAQSDRGTPFHAPRQIVDELFERRELADHLGKQALDL